MALPLLYSYRRCPYAIRARLALRQAGIACDVHEVALRDKPAGMLAASPKGTVPVLVLPSGRVIDQSLEIMLWALQQNDPQGWLTQAPLADSLALIATNDGPFKVLLDRYKYPERHPSHPQAHHRDEAVATVLSVWNSRLQQQRDRADGHPVFLLGDQASLADMALLPFVRQFAQVDRTWFDQSELQALRAWLDHGLSSPLFEAVMAKAAPGAQARA